RTVGEKCARAQLDFVARLEQDFFGRRNFESIQSWALRRVGRHSLGDPCAEDVVFLRILPESLAAFVSDLRRGLEENETLFRCLGIGAATQHVAGERIVIPIRVLAAQRKLEASLAIRIAVTLAGVATG